MAAGLHHPEPEPVSSLLSPLHTSHPNSRSPHRDSRVFRSHRPDNEKEFMRDKSCDGYFGKFSKGSRVRVRSATSSARADTVIHAYEESFIAANYDSLDGKQIAQGYCTRLKRERSNDSNSDKFPEMSTHFIDSETVLFGNKGDSSANSLFPLNTRSHGKADGTHPLKCQDDHRRSKREKIDDDEKSSERFQKLAKIDTRRCRDKISLFQSSLSSAKEKHNDGDYGFEILNAIYTGVEGEGGLNRGEEHDYRSPESEYSYCNPSRATSVTKDILQIPEDLEDIVNKHSDYYDTASQEITHEGMKGKEISPQSASSPSVTNMLQACRSIHEFQRVSKISEGVYGVVFKAQDKKTGEIVAIKKVKMEREKEGFPITSLREINILLSMDHPSIVVVKEVAVDKDLESVYLVMEHMEQDLAGLLATHKTSFSQSEVKYMMLQLLEGVEYIHCNWVLHRDLKPSNLLIDRQGMLKICDFGLARQYGSPLKTYTHKVVSLWYRDPVLLLGSGKYSTAVDMWSLGCIMAELLGKVPLFEGCSELDQLKKIVAVLGSPDETVLQHKLSGVQFNFLREPSKSKLRERFPPMSFTGKTPLSECGFNLLSRLLMYDPNKRISAEEAVRHDWFREDPLPKPLTSSY